MTPLDLTGRPPRACRADLGGILFLARAIDKTRAELPGGRLGAYLIVRADVPTMSGLFYRRMGIAHEAFRDAVAGARDDDSVVAWLRARVSPPTIERWNAQLLSITLGDLAEDSMEVVRELYPGAGGADATKLLADLIDEDDAAMFPSG